MALMEHIGADLTTRIPHEINGGTSRSNGLLWCGSDLPRASPAANGSSPLYSLSTTSAFMSLCASSLHESFPLMVALLLLSFMSFYCLVVSSHTLFEGIGGV